MQLLGAAQQLGGIQARRLGHRLYVLFGVRQELVQRRVQQPDRHRQPVHRAQDAQEVLPLERQERREGRGPGLLPFGQDQVLDELAALPQEHVLGAAQTDALGAEPAGALAVLRGVGVGAHAQPADRVGVRHEAVHGLDELVALVRVELALEVLHDRAG